MDARSLEGPIEGTVRPSGVWTGSEVIVWGGWTQEEGDFGLGGVSGRGAAYDPVTDRWRRIARAPIAARGGHFSTWTGEEMLIWGGYGERAPFVDGAAYDPAADSWRMIASVSTALDLDFKHALTEEFHFQQVWAGSEWIIAYKEGVTDEYDVLRLAAYEPQRDRWRRLPDVRVSRTDAVQFLWTGNEIVLAHFDGVLRFDRVASEWTALASTPGNLPIWTPTVWVGDRVVASIHRFDHPEAWAFLAAWDPTTDTWESLPMPPQSIAYGHLVSDGGRVVPFGSGLAFDYESREWWDVPMSVSERRADYVSVWTGTQMVIWGGWVCGKCRQGVYDEGIVFTPNW